MSDTSSKATRIRACELAAQVCHGHLPTGSTLLAYIILFESYINDGSNETANLMGWDVVEREPVSIAEMRKKLNVLENDRTAK